MCCFSLAQITIPNSVTTIDDYGFSNCYGLTDLNLSNSLTTIGMEAFAFCNALTKVTIPNSVTTIDRYAFGSSKNLREVTMGNSVATIGDGAFYYCESLASMSIPASVTAIGYAAFRGCTRLASISISGTITELPDEVFWACPSLKDVTLPGSVREISATAFHGCNSLTEINVINPIPAVIESETFSACEASATLNVPAGSIEAYRAHPYWGKFNAIATWNCGGSENFTVDNVTYHVLLDGSVEIAAVSAPAARSVSGVIEIPDKVVSDGVSYRVGGVANGGFNGAGYAALVLPPTVGYVGLEAFKECTELTEITCMSQIPPSVGDNSFDEDAYGSVKLIVPEDAFEAYRAHDVWQKFDVLAAKILVTSIVLDPSSWNGNVGDKFHIEATVLPEDAADGSLTWTSSDETVATVDDDGNVTVLKNGNCVITAIANDGSGTEARCVVTGTAGINGNLVESDGEIEIYDLTGSLVMRGVGTSGLKNIAPGFYIIRQGSKISKVFLN